VSPPTTATALRRFEEALLRFSDEPTLANFARYRHASRELEQAKRRDLRRSRRGPVSVSIELD
jgi:hypothetical protein